MKILGAIGSQTGLVRKARKAGKCQECRAVIVQGEVYVVGSQMDYQHGPHAHMRLCLRCAEQYGYPEYDEPRYFVKGRNL